MHGVDICRDTASSKSFAKNLPLRHKTLMHYRVDIFLIALFTIAYIVSVMPIAEHLMLCHAVAKIAAGTPPLHNR
jgi:hypothetical protein